MPRTARHATTRGRILAVTGAAAALAGAGTAAAATTTTAPAPALAGPAAAVLPAARAAASPLAPRTPHPAARHATAATTTARPGTARPGTDRPGTAAAVTRAAGHAAAVTRAAGHAANHTPARHHGTPRRPYQMYDSVTPAAIPGGKAIATYADGPYAASPATLHHRNVTWIDTNATDPAGATVLDVEPGDATPATAATWARTRLDTHPHATAVIYTMRTEWPATQTAIATLPHWQQHHIRYWIADPTGTPHLIPGSAATQWYWGTHYDISTVTPTF